MGAVVAIVQARLGSSRLPGKVLRRAGGRTLLAHLLHRLAAAKSLNTVVVATSDSPLDDELARYCADIDTACFRGSESDVLARFCGAIRAHDADVVVRVTADCPLLDPNEVDRLVDEFHQRRLRGAPVDYLSNQAGKVRKIPHGLDVEVCSATALLDAGERATAARDREHVMPFLYGPNGFRHAASHPQGDDNSDLRLTVDLPEDLALIDTVLGALGDDVDANAAIAWLRAHPDVTALNADVTQKVVLSHDEVRRQRVAGQTLLGRADANETVGTGHVTRLSALLEGWIEAGGRAVMAGHGIVGSAAERLQQMGAEIVNEQLDTASTLTLARRLDAAAIAIDGYGFTAQQIATLRADRTLLAVDDLAQANAGADIVVNQNLGFDVARYRHIPGQLLCGAPYVLMRREFRQPLHNRATKRRVVVTFGGSDPAHLSAKTAHALDATLPKDVLIDVVIGPLAPVTMRDEVGRVGGRVRLLADVMSMTEVLAGATAAVSAAGSTTWELMALGVPTLLVIVAENQRAVAPTAAQSGACINLGWHAQLDIEQVALRVKTLLQTSEQLDDMSRRGRALIDGRGVLRVVDALLHQIAHNRLQDGPTTATAQGE